MDFSQILAEYKGATSKQKKKTSTWWKDEQWNKNAKLKQKQTSPIQLNRDIEKQFTKVDHILSISAKWESAFQWLVQNQCLAGAPVCTICNYDMELSNSGTGFKRDMRMWRCKGCLTRESIRHRSFLSDSHLSL